MSRINLGAKPYTTPQPVWILAAYDENGVANAMNALRKFESAGVIESRSSGMRGTYIKVLNDVVFDELDKIKKEQQHN